MSELSVYELRIAQVVGSVHQTYYESTCNPNGLIGHVVDEVVGVSWLAVDLAGYICFFPDQVSKKGRRRAPFNLHCETDRVSEEAVQVVEEWLLAASSDCSENVVDVAFEGFYGKLGGPCGEMEKAQEWGSDAMYLLSALVVQFELDTTGVNGMSVPLLLAQRWAVVHRPSGCGQYYFYSSKPKPTHKHATAAAPLRVDVDEAVETR
ncbi:LOW QUALITY PROTEIN: hypothetical protein M514_27968 [Trichuris suis]|uniref:Uncharacterized protein n=1 Tax=Trichuris suis TaxID=68888 RepID=A0A085MRK9_9BILA|nr:LOW QUALITY PROTEIN: hypothetical protein M514_27968 [Trichuris suis]